VTAGRRRISTSATTVETMTMASPAITHAGASAKNETNASTPEMLRSATAIISAGRLPLRAGTRAARVQLARVGFVAQDTPVYARMTVAGHLRLGAWLNPGWDDSLAQRRIGQLGLNPKQRAGSLSGGQRAQLALTLAIAKRPGLLLLDEPVASLDPLARREFLGMLMEAVAEHGTSVVLSSHLVADLLVRTSGPVHDPAWAVTPVSLELNSGLDELEAFHDDGCAGKSPLGGLSAVGTGTAYTRDLPKAIREMAAAGSPVSLVLPVMPVQYNRRLGTGTLILDAATGGLGELGITGSAVSDAVIELVASGHPLVKVYVQANTAPHIHGIPDGSYDVYVETGADWDSAAKSFTRGCQYQKFDPPLYFRTTTSTSTIYTISVNKDIAGNTSVTPVSGLP
jgi:ABC-type arginine transport system ATPase subunit